MDESGGVNIQIGGVKSSSSNTIGGVRSSEELLLETIENMPGLNAPTLASQLGKSLRTMQRILKKLSDEGKIIHKGAAKNGGYYKS